MEGVHFTGSCAGSGPTVAKISAYHLLPFDKG
jgi:hypothetical protein